MGQREPHAENQKGNALPFNFCWVLVKLFFSECTDTLRNMSVEIALDKVVNTTAAVKTFVTLPSSICTSVPDTNQIGFRYKISAEL